jgi:hypothetical protein
MTEEIARKIYESPPMTDAVVIAHLWIARGWKVAPCQPGTKKLMRGYGPNLGGLKDSSEIEFWFRYRKANLAVLAPSEGRILDFDDAELYEQFKQKNAAEGLYTELTPRGGAHVFCLEEPNFHFSPVSGLEIKNTAMVYPSQIGGQSYQVIGGKIQKIDLGRILEGFGSVYNPPSPSESPRPSSGQIDAKKSIIQNAKDKWPILAFMTFFAPEVKLTGKGRWRSGLCPFHKDKTPSLWVDAERHIWGCHACSAHGDVVNFWALKKNTSLGVAAHELLVYSESVTVAGVE